MQSIKDCFEEITENIQRAIGTPARAVPNVSVGQCALPTPPDDLESVEIDLSAEDQLRGQA